MKPSQQSPTSQPQTDDSDPVAVIVVAVLIVLGLVILTPFLLGLASVLAAPRLAQRPIYWRHTRSRVVIDTGGVLVVLVLVAVEVLWVRGAYIETRGDLAALWRLLAPMWPWLLVNVAASTLTVPLAQRLARRFYVAKRVAERQLPHAARQDRIIEARAAAAVADTRAVVADQGEAAPMPMRERRRDHLAIGRRVRPGLQVLSEHETQAEQVPGWTVGDHVVLPDDPGAVRAVLLAESGVGKTTFLDSVILAALSQGWGVLMLDAKGAQADATALVERTRAAGFAAQQAHGVRVFGDPDRAYALLASAYQPNGSAADYYAARVREALGVALRYNPVSLDALLVLLRTPAQCPWMHQEHLNRLNAKDRTGTTLGVEAATAIERDWGALAPHLSGEGTVEFATLRGGLTVLPVRPLDDAERLLGQTTLRAYGDHLVRVLRSGQKAAPLLVVMDEFAQLPDAATDPAELGAKLMETARSAGLGLILAGQSEAGLSAVPEMRRRLLGSGAALIAGRTKDPEALAQMVGTTTRLEAAGHADGSQLTSGRTQHAYLLDPNRLRRAGVGQFWLYQAGVLAEFIAYQPASSVEAPKVAA